MADEPIASFLAEFGFAKPDAAGARAVEDLVKRTETRITDVQAREGAKRTAAETKAQSDAVQRLGKWLVQRNEAEEKARDDRTKAAADFMGDMLGLDREQTDKLLKSTKEGAAKSVEVEQLKAKKLSQIRGGQFKEASVDLLRFGAIAEKVSGGLASALSIAPFGAFLTGIERGAAGLARLDIQAKRTGSSAAGIQRFLFAMKQQGVDEAEATSALEGFASTMKSNPQGYRSALEGLPKGGVRTTGPDGKPLGYDAMLENFGSYLAKQPFNIARMQAGQFGISGDNAIAALQDPAGTRSGLQAFDAKLGAFGFDPNKAAEDARKVQQSWNSLEADFAIIKQKLDAEFFLPFMASLDALAKKMEENPQAAENFGRGLEALAIGLSARVLPVLANLGVKLAGLAPILGTGLGTALGIAVNPVVAVGASAESTPTAPVTTDPAERARKLANNTLPAGEMTAEEREAFSKAHGGGLWDFIKKKLGFGGADTADPRVKDAILATAEATKKLAEKADKAEMEGAAGEGGGSFAGTTGTMGSVNRLLGRVRAATGQGYTPAGGGGNTPAKGALAANQKEAYAAALAEGLNPTAARALVANMSGEGLVVPHDRHWDGTHYAQGIVQWDPTRVARIAAQFGKEPMNMSVAEQTKAAIWEMKTRPEYAASWKALQGDNAAEMIGALVDNYERPKQRALPKAQRMGYYRGFNPGAAAPAPTAASTSSVPVGDQAALDAQNRIAAGSGTASDHATIAAHRAQQNTPPARGKPLPTFATAGGMTTTDYRDQRYAPGAHPDDDRASRSRGADVHYGARGHLSPVQYTKGGGDNPLTRLYKDGALKVEVTKPLPGMADLHRAILGHGAGLPSLHHPLGVTPAHSAAISYSRTRGNTAISKVENYHIQGGDPRTMMAEARRTAGRGNADLIRNLQTMET